MLNAMDKPDSARKYFLEARGKFSKALDQGHMIFDLIKTNLEQ